MIVNDMRDYKDKFFAILVQIEGSKLTDTDKLVKMEQFWMVNKETILKASPEIRLSIEYKMGDYRKTYGQS